LRTGAISALYDCFVDRVQCSVDLTASEVEKVNANEYGRIVSGCLIESPRWLLAVLSTDVELNTAAQ